MLKNTNLLHKWGLGDSDMNSTVRPNFTTALIDSLVLCINLIELRCVLFGALVHLNPRNCSLKLEIRLQAKCFETRIFETVLSVTTEVE